MSILLFAALALLFAMTARRSPHVRGVNRWAIGLAAMSLGLGMNALQHSGPKIVSFVLGTAVLAWGSSMMIAGVQRFRQTPVRMGLPYAVIAAMLCLNGWYTFGEFSAQHRTVITSVALTLIGGYGAFVMYRTEPGPARLAYWFGASSYLLGALCMAARAVLNLDATTFVAGYGQHWFNGVAMMIATCCAATTAFSFLLLVSHRMTQHLDRLAEHDPLTGSLNRRGFDRAVAQLQANARRADDQLPVALMLVDLDHFKLVNDRFGHAHGDEVLRDCADLMRHSVRETDIFARIGGEEFCIVLHTLSHADAIQIAERLRKRFELRNAAFMGSTRTLRPGQERSLPTVSAGLVLAHAPWGDFGQLLLEADAALYQAKHEGRNRIVTRHLQTAPAQALSALPSR